MGVWSLPNQLTILRILMTPLIILLLLYRASGSALAVFCLAGLTDALDGFIARSFRQKTSLGMVLDPLADKLLFASCFVTLAFLREIPGWFAVVAVSRDVILIGGALLLLLFTGKVGVPPSVLGKGATGLQFLVILLTMLDTFFPLLSRILPPLVVATALITVSSGLEYVYRGAQLLGE